MYWLFFHRDLCIVGVHQIKQIHSHGIIRKYPVFVIQHTLFVGMAGIYSNSNKSLVNFLKNKSNITLSAANSVHSTSPGVLPAWGVSCYTGFSFVEISLPLASQSFGGSHETAERSTAYAWSETLSATAWSAGNALKIISKSFLSSDNAEY